MMSKTCRLNTLLLIGIAIASGMAGCTSKAPESRVRGSVTLDGKPLANGRITFVAADASVQNAEAAIVDGRFEAAVPPGEKRIEIRAPKATGRTTKMYDAPGAPAVDAVGELLPSRYNVDSELTMTVAEGEQEKSFELTSK